MIATVDPAKDTKKDISEEVLLQAVDSAGKALNVLISPQTVNVKIAVTMNKKALPVSLEKTGAVSGYQYTLTTDTQNVTVYGKQQTLAKLSSLPVTVDLSDVTSSTTKTVKISLPDGVYDSSPTSIKVKVAVTSDGNEASSQSSAATMSTSASTSSSQSESTSSSSTDQTSSSTDSSASTSQSTTTE